MIVVQRFVFLQGQGVPAIIILIASVYGGRLVVILWDVYINVVIASACAGIKIMSRIA
jgi:hypothetical protein